MPQSTHLCQMEQGLGSGQLQLSSRPREPTPWPDWVDVCCQNPHGFRRLDSKQWEKAGSTQWADNGLMVDVGRAAGMGLNRPLH